MKKPNSDPIGWRDWHVIVAMILFLFLIICSRYTEMKFLKYVSFVPVTYAVLRCIAQFIE